MKYEKSIYIRFQMHPMPSLVHTYSTAGTLLRQQRRTRNIRQQLRQMQDVCNVRVHLRGNTVTFLYDGKIVVSSGFLWLIYSLHLLTRFQNNMILS